MKEPKVLHLNICLSDLSLPKDQRILLLLLTSLRYQFGTTFNQFPEPA